MGVSVCMCRRVGKKHEAKIFLLLEEYYPQFGPKTKLLLDFSKKNSTHNTHNRY